MDKLLILVAPPYVNNRLHVAHIRSTYLPADILARYSRLKKREVYFVGGADEYGVAVLLEAEKAGKEPIEIINRYYPLHAEDFRKMNISFDIFSRTTGTRHKQTVLSFYESSRNHGRIYSKQISMPFCENCNGIVYDRYLGGICSHCNSEADGDHCSNCGKHLELNELLAPYCKKCGQKISVKHDNHIFYKIFDKTEEIKSKVLALELMPNEVKKMTRAVAGFQDWDITRYYPWGIKIPEQEDKVFYMIFEAFCNYVSFTADLEAKLNKPGLAKEIWKEKSQWKHAYFMGRDLVFLHISIWQLMTEAMGYKAPDIIHGAGLLNIGGKKMSKSKGWMITLDDFLKHFHPDLLRYYFTSFAQIKADAEFNWYQFSDIIQQEFLMFPEYLSRILLNVQDLNRCDISSLKKLFEDAGKDIDVCNLDSALKLILNYYADASQLTVSPSEAEYLLASLPVLLYPFVPQTAENLWHSLGYQTAVGTQLWVPLNKKLPSETDEVISQKMREAFPKINQDDIKAFMSLLPQIALEAKSCALATEAAAKIKSAGAK